MGMVTYRTLIHHWPSPDDHSSNLVVIRGVPRGLWLRVAVCCDSILIVGKPQVQVFNQKLPSAIWYLLGSVVRSPDHDIALIASQVIDPVRHGFALCRRGEIVELRAPP